MITDHSEHEQDKDKKDSKDGNETPYLDQKMQIDRINNMMFDDGEAGLKKKGYKF